MKILETIDILSIEQIEACLVDIADTITHCADNYLSVDIVMKMVRSSLRAQMEEVILDSLCELDERRVGAIKQRTKYQTQARKSL